MSRTTYSAEGAKSNGTKVLTSDSDLIQRELLPDDQVLRFISRNHAPANDDFTALGLLEIF